MLQAKDDHFLLVPNILIDSTCKKSDAFSPARRYDMIVLFLNCLGTGLCLCCDNKIAHYCNLDVMDLQIIKLLRFQML
jgi:hypothetical protein